MQIKKCLLSCVAIASVMGLCGHVFAGTPTTLDPKLLKVTARIQSACSFDVKKNVEFGEVHVNTDAFATGLITVDCPYATKYMVALGGGNAYRDAVATGSGGTIAPLTTSVRYMESTEGSYAGVTGKLGYELYTSSTYTEVWGDKPVTPFTGNATEYDFTAVYRAAGYETSEHEVFGKIKGSNIATTNLPVSYADQVKATLTFQLHD